jgi:hypothetical protein
MDLTEGQPVNLSRGSRRQRRCGLAPRYQGRSLRKNTGEENRRKDGA